MKKLWLVLLPLSLLACSQNPPPNIDVGSTLDQICKLCPKTPCPECPACPECPPPPVYEFKPQCQDGLTAGCWKENQYISCPVFPPDPPADPCKNVTCNSNQTCQLGICVDNPSTDPVKDACGLSMPEDASAWVNTSSYGQGLDTALYVQDWPALCIFIHGNPVNPNSCHLEGLDSKGYSRVKCEMAIIEKESNGAGKCPVAIWRNPGHMSDNKCFQVNDDPSGMSCDHFGNTVDRDDPNTPNVFEGEPKECAAQRDESGNPMAGFFWIGHGDGEMKACLPNYTGCSRSWRRVVH